MCNALCMFCIHDIKSQRIEFHIYSLVIHWWFITDVKTVYEMKIGRKCFSIVPLLPDPIVPLCHNVQSKLVDYEVKMMLWHKVFVLHCSAPAAVYIALLTWFLYCLETLLNSRTGTCGTLMLKTLEIIWSCQINYVLTIRLMTD